MNVVEVSGLTKNYPLDETVVHALRGVDLQIAAGDLLSIVGPSGSGKTTLLNMIGCIDQPSSGSVRIDGVEIAKLHDHALTDLRLHTIGFIFQTFNLIPVLDARENVEFPLLLMGKFTAKEVRYRADEFLEKVGLSKQKRQRPAELSGGQRQRVAIARALVTMPKLVLADEPTANLDSETGASILDLMAGMNRSSGTTFIFSTHDADVLRYARRVVRIHDGRIVEA